MKFTQVSKIDNDFHWKPFNKEFETKKVPVWLFNGYVEARAKYLDLRKELESYFNGTPIKSVREGEVVKL